LAAFYGDLLEWPIPEGDDDFVALDPPDGGTAITFQRAAGFVAPTWPHPAVQQQMHLDLAVDDLDAAHVRAVARGARHWTPKKNFGSTRIRWAASSAFASW